MSEFKATWKCQYHEMPCYLIPSMMKKFKTSFNRSFEPISFIMDVSFLSKLASTPDEADNFSLHLTGSQVNAIQHATDYEEAYKITFSTTQMKSMSRIKKNMLSIEGGVEETASAVKPKLRLLQEKEEQQREDETAEDLYDAPPKKKKKAELTPLTQEELDERATGTAALDNVEESDGIAETESKNVETPEEVAPVADPIVALRTVKRKPPLQKKPSVESLDRLRTEVQQSNTKAKK